MNEQNIAMITDFLMYYLALQDILFLFFGGEDGIQYIYILVWGLGLFMSDERK